MFSRLKRSRVRCSINGDHEFLPLEVLQREVTEDNVRISLRQWSRLPIKLLPLGGARHLPRKIMEQAKKVFAILEYIGEPEAMRGLLADGLTDEQLPLHLDEQGTTPISPTGKTFSRFTTMNEQRINDFIDKQWMVLAPSIDSSGQHVVLDRRCPLPFEESTTIGHGLTADVHKCKLHSAHYMGDLQYPNMEYVASKEFWREDAFRQEEENLKLLAALNHDHLIKHLGTFTRNTTHYVIYPWAAGGTLADFWEHQNLYARGTSLIVWCLQQMLGIAQAIEALHSINCRHGDMKPENILHFSGPNGRLVVSDVGVSRKHDKATRLRQGGTTTRATTPSYEAPETFSTKDTPRARRYDVWSIGCIFLEFSLWILHDMASIESFHHARHGPDYAFYIANTSATARRKPEIHPVVTTALKLLRQDLRCKGDTIFGNFLDLIEERLLQVNVDQRAEAVEMVTRLREIVQDAELHPAKLFNDVAPPEKLRFPKRTQTGATLASVDDTIPE